MILLIDNYDSFSYNLYQKIGEIMPEVEVVRNDAITLEEIAEKKPTHIVLSPGPGKPKDAGICEEVIRQFAGKIPILGVCLGHQAICEVFGGKITYAKEMMHGKQSVIATKEGCALFEGIADPVKVARYHSLVCAADSVPDSLEVLAIAEDGEIMAVKHKEYPIFGMQFHPESILTPHGTAMLQNFFNVYAC